MSVAQKAMRADPIAHSESRLDLPPAELRASLVPGAILIILAGRYRGKRVVLLRALEDNTLLVTGPFQINGVPLRRVHPRYVIATSTTVSLSGVPSLGKFSVEYFVDAPKIVTQATEEALFDDVPEESAETNEQRIQDQKNVDTPLIAEIEKVQYLKEYLATPFTLRNGDRPHLLKF